MQTHTGILAGRRLVFYTDAKGFGGHDIQSLRALRCLLEAGADMTCFYRESTRQWGESLQKLQKDFDFSLHPLTLPHVRFHRSYHFFNPGLTRSLGRRLQEHRPEAVFISQGNLEISALGSLAARKAGIPSLSYIALAHSFRELRANRASRRDCFNRYLATVPTRWLTISESMRARLRERGARQPIDLMPNLVELPQALPSRAVARRSLGLPEDALVIGMAGRLEPKQKGTDVFLQSLRTLPEGHPLRCAWVLLLGDGAGRQELCAQLEKQGWAGRVKWQPWSEEPWCFYPAYDLLLAPSYFEGLPIAVQEAVLCGVPVAASNVDGLGEFLPAHWTCPPSDPSALRNLMENYLRSPDAYRQALPERADCVRRDFNRAAAENALLSSLGQLLSEKGVAQGR